MGLGIGPVHLAARHVESDAARIDKPCGDQIFDSAAVKVGALNDFVSSIGPVHLTASDIQSYPFAISPSGNEIFHTCPVQVGPANPAGREDIRPVHLASGYIQGDADRTNRSHQVLNTGAVYIGASQLLSVRLSPVHFAARQIQSDALRRNPRDHDVFQAGTEQVGALDLASGGVSPIHAISGRRFYECQARHVCESSSASQSARSGRPVNSIQVTGAADTAGVKVSIGSELETSAVESD